MYATPRIVSDVMTHTVAAVGRRAPFKELVRMMQDWQVSALPVLDPGGRVVGVVSEADLLKVEERRDGPEGEPAGSRQPDGIPKPGAPGASGTSGASVAPGAEDLMTSPAITVRAGATLAEAARVMSRSGVKRLPVVDGLGLLEGVVSRGDLLKVFLRPDEDIAREIRREIVAYLFPLSAATLQVDVDDGVATLRGRIDDTSLVPVAARLVRAVEGVVDVEFDLAREAGTRGVLGTRDPVTEEGVPAG